MKRIKIFIVGDFISDRGPAIVNKNIISSNKDKDKKYYHSKASNRLVRIIELFVYSVICDITIFSGLSKINKIGIKICGMLNKPTIYLMHGCLTVENEINQFNRENDIMLESMILKNIDSVVCVSEKFSIFIKQNYPDIAHKVTYVNNGLNWELYKGTRETYITNLIISIGGGVRIKNNLDVCKAIEKINNSTELKLKFIIIGEGGTDIEQIKKYDFVTHMSHMTHEKTLKELQLAQVYIQNSYFETFGLGIMEALMSGCDVLVSKNIGILSIIKQMSKEYVINNNEDIEEIAAKIKYVLHKSNNNQIIKSINKDKTSWAKFNDNLIEECRKLIDMKEEKNEAK